MSKSLDLGPIRGRRQSFDCDYYDVDDLLAEINRLRGQVERVELVALLWEAAADELDRTGFPNMANQSRARAESVRDALLDPEDFAEVEE